MAFIFTSLMWVLAGFVYSNWLEWVVHKHLLHGLGKKRNSFWSFHWSGHHRSSRKNEFRDVRWENIPFYKDKEFLGVTALVMLHLPVALLAPVFFGTLVWRAAEYYRVHKKSHENTEWAKQNVPWHWDHHMGPRKAVEANWCVTNPFFDNLMGTRVKYYLTTEYFLNELKKKDKQEYERVVAKLDGITTPSVIRAGSAEVSQRADTGTDGIHGDLHREDQSQAN